MSNKKVEHDLNYDQYDILTSDKKQIQIFNTPFEKSVRDESETLQDSSQ